ncbi:hypothetical protein [Helicobacter suis]|uniref:hypothetical protein n=1 Tax=Helicobacter suis TaxID=104628 RepID=UPI0013D4DE53|nr:hypothetical protein [Helicobacter suis]
MLDVMAQRYNALEQDLQQEFYSKVKAYIKGYEFLVQILPFEDISLEKLFRLLVYLIKKLPRDKNLDDVTQVVALEDYRLQKEQKAKLTLTEPVELKPSKIDSSKKTPQTQEEKLSEILEIFHREQGITLDENTKQAKAKTLDNILNKMRSDLTFLDNLKHADSQNRQISFHDKFKEQLPNLAEKDPQLYTMIVKNLIAENPDFKDPILQNLLKVFEEGLEGLGVN